MFDDALAKVCVERRLKVDRLFMLTDVKSAGPSYRAPQKEIG
ncbi:MAG: hypothetical protein U0930_25060 [Pirellulales bacterium]